MPSKGFQPSGMLAHKIFGLAVDRDVLFSNHKGIYKKRIEKRQRKLIVKLAFVKPFLKRDEKILLVTTGYSPLGSLAQYLTGFIFVYLKRALFVFTNHRIIHVPTSPAYKYKNCLAQILYAGCQALSLKGGTLTVRFARFGRVEKFAGIAGAERKKIRSLITTLPLAGTKSLTSERTHLCPRCTHQLQAATYRCANCRLKFKSRIVAAIAALLVPGGGYFYIRYYLIGFLNLLLEGFLIGTIAILAGKVAGGVPGGLSSLVIVSAVFIVIKIISIIHSSHFTLEFIPVEQQIKPPSRILPKK